MRMAAGQTGVTLLVACVAACSSPHPPQLIDSSAGPDPACGSGISSICNVIAQLGCNEGEKCTHSVPSFPTCGIPGCAPDGTLPAGAACDELDDQCAAGSLCLDGTCHEYCFPDGPGDRCSVGLCVPNELSACSAACDPLAPTCSPGTECYLPLRSTFDSPGCLSPGSGVEGSSCGYANACASGLTCAGETFDTLGFSSCRKRCLVGDATCAATETCTERHPDDGYGVCL